MVGEIRQENIWNNVILAGMIIIYLMRLNVWLCMVAKIHLPILVVRNMM